MIARDTEMIARLTMTVDVAAQPTAAANYVRAVVDFAATRGVPRRALLMSASLTDADLADDAARIPVAALIAVFRGAAHHAADGAFALRFGSHVPCNQVSLAASMGQSASTVTDALHQLNRYARLGIDFPALGTADRFRIARDGRTVAIIDERPADGWPELTEVVFARMALGVRRVAGHDILRAVHVTHAAPSHRAAYGEHFGVPVHFDSPRNALLLDAAFLDTPLTPAPTLVTRILETEANARLRALDEQRSCRGRVAAVLRTLMPTGDVRVDRVASLLAMSRQTLYRRLRSEGTTFELVLDDTRRAMVFERLRTGNASVRTLATAAAFSDAAAFSRAFKRWTGRSPGAALRDPSLVLS